MDHKETRCIQLTLLQAFKAHSDKTVTGEDSESSISSGMMTAILIFGMNSI